MTGFDGDGTGFAVIVTRIRDRWSRIDRGWQATLLGFLVVVGVLLGAPIPW